MGKRVKLIFAMTKKQARVHNKLWLYYMYKKVREGLNSGPIAKMYVKIFNYGIVRHNSYRDVCPSTIATTQLNSTQVG